jgi:hypothetical protein
MRLATFLGRRDRARKPVAVAPDHVPRAVLARYAAGAPGFGTDALWTVEAHLESCPSCRGVLAEALERYSPETASLLNLVGSRLATELPRTARMPARRRRRVARWAPPGLWAWLVMALAVVGAALGLDVAGSSRVLPSLVLLVAPVAPLIGVASLWSTGLDPAHELVVASPRAGLYMVLRRTLAVLIVVVPALTVAGLAVGASPARWLLPCLAFTAGALVLGELIGLGWAAFSLGLAWTAGVIAPSLLAARTPLLLEPASLPYWSGFTVLIGLALLLRRDAYTGLRSAPWFVR